MFSIAIIVFRESLEVAIFVSIVLAAAAGVRRQFLWISGGILVGILGAISFALFGQTVSNWVDGIGQDLLVIAILLLAISALIWHYLWIAKHSKTMIVEAKKLGKMVREGSEKPWALTLVIALAVLREGGETVLFVSGAIASTQAQGTYFTNLEMILNAAVGLIGGIAIGILIYKSISIFKARYIFSITNILIAFLAAAMGGEIGLILSKIGLLPTGSNPIWDTSNLIETDSIVGKILHSVIGYDANPSAAQLGAYLFVLMVFFISARMVKATAAK